MDKSQVKRRLPSKKEVLINIRVSSEIKKWLDDNDYSPTLIFYASLAELECPALLNRKNAFIKQMENKKEARHG